jgi:hypothetical protein
VSPLEFRDDVGQHEYWLDGERMKSVTAVLRDAGLINFDGIPIGTLAAARERGTRVHKAISYFNENDLALDKFREDFPSDVGYLDGWLNFCSQRRFVPVLNEHRVASRRYMVAGTLDTLGTLDGAGVLLDFATGDAAAVCKQLQTAGYELLAREWSIEDPTLAEFFEQHASIRRYAIELNRDGSFRIRGYTSPSDHREFIALVTAQAVVRKYRSGRVGLGAA